MGTFKRSIEVLLLVFFTEAASPITSTDFSHVITKILTVLLGLAIHPNT